MRRRVGYEIGQAGEDTGQVAAMEYLDASNSVRFAVDDTLCVMPLFVSSAFSATCFLALAPGRHVAKGASTKCAVPCLNSGGGIGCARRVSRRVDRVESGRDITSKACRIAANSAANRPCSTSRCQGRRFACPF